MQFVRRSNTCTQPSAVYCLIVKFGGLCCNQEACRIAGYTAEPIACTSAVFTPRAGVWGTLQRLRLHNDVHVVSAIVLRGRDR